MLYCQINKMIPILRWERNATLDMYRPILFGASAYKCICDT